MYADDLCCFAPTFDGLQELVSTSFKYAKSHFFVLNANKSTVPCHSSRKIDPLLLAGKLATTAILPEK